MIELENPHQTVKLYSVRTTHDHVSPLFRVTEEFEKRTLHLRGGTGPMTQPITGMKPDFVPKKHRAN